MSFEDFWNLYPRRVAKFTAQTAWGKALKSATESEILEGVKKYAASVAGKEKQFVKHPATWLRGGCWLDEDEPQKPKAYDSVGEFLARWQYHARKQGLEN